MKKDIFSYYFISSNEIVFKGLASVLMNDNNYYNPALCVCVCVYIYIYIYTHTHARNSRTINSYT